MISFNATGPRKSALGPTDLFALKFLRNGRFSPDGRRIAYTVSETENGHERYVIFVADLDGAGTERLSFDGNATAPRWSPDGALIAFVGDGQLCLVSSENLREVRRYALDGHFQLGAASWSPDGRRLVASFRSVGDSGGARWITEPHYRAEGTGYLEGIVQALWVLDLETGAFRSITTGEAGLCAQPEWSPAGDRILCLSSRDLVPSSSYSPNVMIHDVESGRVSTLLGDDWFIKSAAWLADGAGVIVAGTPDQQLTVPNPALWVVGLDGTATLRTTDLMGKIGGTIHHDMPAWDLTSDHLIRVLDEGTAYITLVTKGAMAICRVSLKGDVGIVPILSGERSCIVLDVHAGSGHVLFASMSLLAPPELCLAALDGSFERRLSALNDDELQRWPDFSVEALTCRSDDGLEFDAWFLAKSGRSRPLPTITFIHGGPFASTGHAFRYDFLMLASQGFGLVFANFRGLAGYGDDFTRAVMGDWGARAFPDHMATVDCAIALGMADPNRLGVWGASHGGFATCWVVGHTTRFRAAVAEASFTNMTTLYYLTDGPEVFARDLGGKPHEIPDVYRSRSPLTYAHRCTTPTLMLHGEADLRTPIAEAEQFYRALQDANCVTELVRVPGCNHFGDSSGPLSARETQNQALLKWFGEHL